MVFISLDPIASLLLWGVALQNTRGSFDYCPNKTMLQINLSYQKGYSLHNLVRREEHYNHYNLDPIPFYRE
jgi:hypothetical protein